jgi:menaquinone-dependent protoporphyrinogen IX oxidase
MKGMVVYDLEFGNARKIAEAMGHALDGRVEVMVAHVGEFGERQWADVDILLSAASNLGKDVA